MSQIYSIDFSGQNISFFAQKNFGRVSAVGMLKKTQAEYENQQFE